MTPVVHNPALHRFEINFGADVALLNYRSVDGRIRLLHTEVPVRLRGQGHANQLARAALDYARDAHLRVIPSCPFVRQYVERHPEYASLVDRDAGQD